jgi:hypothetical protein
MNRHHCVTKWIGLSVAALAAALSAVSNAAERKPNVIVFLSDDVGYAEYGFQGSKDIPTPHIDSIAKSGVRFTQGYVSGPYCSPTRAGLMTAIGDKRGERRTAASACR